MTLENLLSLLADGEFHSGEELGFKLGISRAAVFKHLDKLSAFGLLIKRVRGKGYKLQNKIELLSKPLIQGGLEVKPQRLLNTLDVLFVVDSTNTIATNYAENHSGSKGYACFAECQTAGKGRRGRNWVSPFGANLYLSILWGFEDGPEMLSGLSLAVGVAAVKALEALGGEGFQLKWPNDILWRGKKLAGILVEVSGAFSGYCQVVIGLGINLNMPKTSATEIDQEWSDLQEALNNPSRNQVASALLNQLLPMLDTFEKLGFPEWQRDWEALDAYRDKKVELKTSADTFTGIACGVTESGAIKLRLSHEHQVVSFSGGEVTLRGAK